jgi:hypothetical protein
MPQTKVFFLEFIIVSKMFFMKSEFEKGTGWVDKEEPVREEESDCFLFLRVKASQITLESSTYTHSR